MPKAFCELTFYLAAKRSKVKKGSMKKIVFLMSLVLIQSLAFAVTFESSERQVTLLELYSSEGCSSCPPADEWVRGFLQLSNLWKHYVPVVFHVDYWDSLGWKDSLASPIYTERQKNYARNWKNSNLFTPNVVINGKNWKKWQRVKTLPTFNQNVGVLKIELQSQGKYQVSFKSTVEHSEPYEAHLVLLGFDIQSIVPRGENSGKILKHDFVVLDYQSGVMQDASIALNLNSQDERAKKLGIAAWVSEVGSPVPIQATGGYLER